MSRKARLIVECEDALHRSFATRFFANVGVPSGKEPEIQVRGGKERVLNNLPGRIQAVRRLVPEAHLIILIDEDNWDDAKIRAEIDARLLASGHPRLTPDDRVLIIVPRWQMDTWVRHLRGELVNEADNPWHKLAHDSEGREPATKLADHCRNHRPLDNPLPSLEAACRDWQAYRQRHGL